MASTFAEAFAQLRAREAQRACEALTTPTPTPAVPTPTVDLVQLLDEVLDLDNRAYRRIRNVSHPKVHQAWTEALTIARQARTAVLDLRVADATRRLDRARAATQAASRLDDQLEPPRRPSHPIRRMPQAPAAATVWTIDQCEREAALAGW